MQPSSFYPLSLSTSSVTQDLSQREVDPLSVEENSLQTSLIASLAHKIREMWRGSEESLEETCDHFEIVIPENMKHKMDKHLFANLHGDALIAYSDLEGGDPAVNLAFFLKVIQNSFRSSLPEREKLYQDLERLRDLDHKMKECATEHQVDLLASEIVEYFKQMQPGEIFLFPGGWRAKPSGHFMLYEFQRREEGFALKIVNTGEGIQYHFELQAVDKTFYQPFVQIHEIPLENILSKTFWKSTICFSTAIRSKIHVDSEDVYENWLKLLGGKWMDQCDAPQVVVQKQRAGSCSVKTFLAYFKMRLGLEAAKDLIFQIKFWSLANEYAHEKTPQNYSDRLLREKAASSLAKAALKRNERLPALFENGTFVDDLIKVYQLTKAVLDQCGQSEILLMQNEVPYKNERGEQTECILPNLVPNFKKILEPKQEEPEEEPVRKKAAPQDSKEDLLLSMKGPFLSNWVKDLPLCLNFLKIKGYASDMGPFYLHRILQDLPIPTIEDHSCLREIQDTAAISDNLRLFANYLFIWKKKLPPVAMLVNFLHLYALADKIAHQSILHHHQFDTFRYGLHVPFFQILFPSQSSLTLLIDDLKDQQRLLALYQYFTQRQAPCAATLFNYCYENQGISVKICPGIEHQCADFALIKSIAEKLKNEKIKRMDWQSQWGYLFTSLNKANPLTPEYFHLREIFIFYNIYLTSKQEGINYYINDKSYKNFGNFIDFPFFLKKQKNKDFLELNLCWKKTKKSNEQKITIASNLNFNSNSNLNLKNYSRLFFYLNNLSKLKEHSACFNILLRQYSQNEGLSGVVSNFPFNSLKNHELERMVDIHLCDHLKIPLALQYYSENFKLLKSEFHQEFFSYTLFQNLKLLKSIKEDLFFENILIQFFKKTFALTLRNPKYIDASLYLIDLFAQTALALPRFNESKEETSLIQLKQEINHYLIQVIQTNPQSSKEERRCDAFCSLLTLHTFSSYKTAEDLKAILQGILILSLKGLIYSDFSIDIQKLFVCHEIWMNLIEDQEVRNQIFNEIWQIMPTTPPFTGQWVGTFPLYQSGPWQIDLVQGSLLCDGRPLSSISSFRLKQTFSNLVDFFFEQEGLNQVPEHQPLVFIDNIYYNSTKTVKITKNAGLFSFEQKFMDKWYDLQKFQYDCIPFSLVLQLQKQSTQVSYWLFQDTENPEILVRDQKGKILYQISFLVSKKILPENQVKNRRKRKSQASTEVSRNNQKIFKYCYIKEFDTGLIYYPSSKLNDKKSIIRKLAEIADFNKLNCWMDPTNQQIRRIDLYEYNLTLQVEGDHYSILEYPGYEVINDKLSSSVPFKTFKYFLHLRNADDKHLLIIFKRSFHLKRGNKKDPLRLKQQEGNKLGDSFYKVYPFNPKTQQIQANGIEEKLLLALCFITEQKNEQVFELLLQCRKDEYFSPRELDLLSDCFYYTKTSELPTAWALAVQILLLYRQNLNYSYSNHSKIPIEVNTWARHAECSIYLRYLSALSSIPLEFRLDRMKELYLLQWLRRVDPHSLQLEAREKSLNTGTHFPLGKRDNKYLQGRLKNKIVNIETPNFPPDCFSAIEAQEHPLPSLDFTSALVLNKEMVTLFKSLFSSDIEQVMLARSLILFCMEKALTYDFLKYVIWNQQFCLHLLKEKLGENFLKNPKESIDLILRHMEHPEPSSIVQHPHILFKDEGGVEARSSLRDCQIKWTEKVQFSKNVPFSHQAALQQSVEARLKIFDKSFHAFTKQEHHSSWKLPLHSPLYQKISQQPTARELYQNCLEKLDNHPLANQHYQLKTDYQTLMGDLEHLREGAEKKAKEFLGRAVDLANKTFLDHRGTMSLQDMQRVICEKLEIISGNKHSILLKDLILWILQDNFEELKKRNPYLSESEREEVYSLILTGMVYEVEAHHLANLQQVNHQEISSSPSAINKIAEGIQAKRMNYQDKEEQRLLAFESLSKIMLRLKQVDLIKQALRDKQLNFIFQLMMGEGKTKVILPCLALMFADGTKLPVVVVPFSLRNQNLNDLREESLAKFQQQVFTFTFSRESDISHNRLLLIKNKLLEIQSQRGYGYVLTTPENLQALILKYIELTLIIKEQEAKNEQEKEGSLKSLKQSQLLLAQIIHLFQTSGVAIIDEVHQLFKCLQEVNFTYQASHTFDSCEVNAIMQLYEVIMKLSPSFSHNLFEEEKWQETKRCIVKSLIELTPSSSSSLIFKYLMEEEPNISFLEKMHTVHPEEACQIALWKEELSTFLPHTLSKKLNVHYGKSPKSEIEYAIPYLGNNTPSALSEFGHPHVMLNYTLQMLLQEGLTKKQFLIWVKNLQAQALTAAANGIQERGSELLGEDILAFDRRNEQAVHKLWEKLKKDPEVIFDYFKHFVVHKIRIHSQKLNSNAQDLGNLIFSSSIGLTGTPYNQATYPFNFFNRCQIDEKDLGKLLKTLAHPRNQNIISVKEESLEEVLLNIQERIRNERDICALIDAAAFLQGVSNAHVAESLLSKIAQIAGVVYFDDKTNKVVVLKRGKSEAESFRQEEWQDKPYFVYYDHLHSFGADIPLSPSAKGMITFGKDISFYQILQATKRMRQLEFGQSIQFVLTKKLMQQIKAASEMDALNTGHLMAWSISNEAKELERELIISTMHKLHHLIRKSFIEISIHLTLNRAESELQESCLAQGIQILTLSREILSNSGNELALQSINAQLLKLQSDKQRESEARAEFDQELSRTLITNLPLNAYETYRFLHKEVNTKEFFYQFVSSYKFPELLRLSKEKIETIIQSACEKLPETIHSSQIYNLQQEVHHQEEKNEEKNHQVESHHHLTHKGNALKEEPWEVQNVLNIGLSLPHPLHSLFHHGDGSSLRYYSLNDAWIASGGCSLFEWNLYTTRNFLIWSDYQTNLDLDYKLRPVDFFIQIIVQKGHFLTFDSHYLILSLEEAEKLAQQWAKIKASLPNSPSIKFIALRKIDGTSLYQEGDLTFEERERSALSLARIQMMLLNGCEYFGKDLEEPLQIWIQDKTAAVEETLMKIKANRKTAKSNSKGNIFDLLKKIERKNRLGELEAEKKSDVSNDTMQIGDWSVTLEELTNTWFSEGTEFVNS